MSPKPTTHTAEPWTYNRDHAHLAGAPGDNGPTYVGTLELSPHNRNKMSAPMDGHANGERIAACVNACAGIEHPAYAIEMLRAVFYTGGATENPAKVAITRALFDRIRAMVEAADAATNR